MSAEILKFRPDSAAIVVSYDQGNWRADLFDEDCSPIGVHHFGAIPLLLDYLRSQWDEGWRFLFRDGASFIRSDLQKAVTLSFTGGWP